MDGRSGVRLLCSWIYGNVWSSNGFKHAASVGGGVLKRCITVNGADPKQLQGWVMDSEENGKSVLI